MKLMKKNECISIERKKKKKSSQDGDEKQTEWGHTDRQRRQIKIKVIRLWKSMLSFKYLFFLFFVTKNYDWIKNNNKIISKKNQSNKI